MFLDTAWLAYNIPRIYVPPVEAYRTAALEKIHPVFDNLEQDAESVAEASLSAFTLSRQTLTGKATLATWPSGPPSTGTGTAKRCSLSVKAC